MLSKSTYAKICHVTCGWFTRRAVILFQCSTSVQLLYAAQCATLGFSSTDPVLLWLLYDCLIYRLKKMCSSIFLECLSVRSFTVLCGYGVLEKFLLVFSLIFLLYFSAVCYFEELHVLKFIMVFTRCQKVFLCSSKCHASRLHSQGNDASRRQQHTEVWG